MCTLILKKPSDATQKLQIFGNRDERLDRAASGFRQITIEKTIAWAPQDLEKGGTWLGVNQHGLFAGLTNRYAPQGYPNADPTMSRGELPQVALAHDNVGAAAHRIRSMLSSANYPGFHLLLSTHDEARLMVWDGETLREDPLTHETTVITERSFAGPAPERETLLRDMVSPMSQPLSLDEVTNVLSTHAPNSMDAVCVHLDGINYGTRTAVCINLGPSVDETEVWESNSPPCDAKWRKVGLGVNKEHDT